MIQYICACMLSHSNYVRLSATPWMVACPPGSSVHGILQARFLKWVSMPSSRGIFPTQGSNSCLLWLLHCRQIFYRWATREALQNDHHNKSSSHLSVTKVIKKIFFFLWELLRLTVSATFSVVFWNWVLVVVKRVWGGCLGHVLSAGNHFGTGRKREENI